MPIPTSAAWLASTSTTFGVRGDRLKALDKAIRDYELMATQENLVRIQEKLTIYNTAKGANWKDNERNSKNAITNLVKELQVQLYGVEAFSLTLEELAAVEDWKAARKEAARRLFAGTQLVNKVDSLTQQKQLRGAKTSEAVSTGVNLRTIGMSIDQLVTLAMRKAVSPGVFDEVLAYCHASGLYADVTAEMAKIAPALSIISNGATLV